MASEKLLIGPVDSPMQNESFIMYIIERNGDLKEIANEQFNLNIFQAALLYNKPAAVREILSRNIPELNVNCKFEGGLTPLHIAAKFAFIELVDLLLAENADPEARTELGTSVLGMIAAPVPNPEIVASEEAAALAAATAAAKRGVDKKSEVAIAKSFVDYINHGPSVANSSKVEDSILAALKKQGKPVPQKRFVVNEFIR